MPHAKHATGLDSYIASNEAASAWWSEFPKYIVSLMKAYFGDAARKENDYLFNSLPRLTGNHSHMTTVAQMADGKLQGYFVMGENPVVGSMNGALQRKGLRNLKWLVVRDFALTETAEFWRKGPEFESGELRPEDVQTEVFFFPAATHTEKDGSFTNTQRMLQWHHKAIEPPGDCRSELSFLFHLGCKLKALYEDSKEQRDIPIRALNWNYPTRGPHEEPDAEAVLFEINGYTMDGKEPVSGYPELKDDGSTSCGCWIYSGCYAEGVNQPARRKPQTEQTWVAPEWGWAWPANRRLLYNRASARPDGKPWSERKKYIWWDEAKQCWTGFDVPDFIKDRAPSYRPPQGATGLASISGVDAFIMQADGKGWIFAPAGMLDGPLPTHYEPQESPVPNPLYRQQCNPVRQEWRRRDNPYHRAWGDPRFPFAITTFRLTEHHTSGAMSRWLSWLSELQPELFCEISPELAALKSIRHGDWCTVSTARGEIACRAMVTERIKPLRLGKRTVHQIALPYHWGFVGRTEGDVVNDLIHFVADPNVNIQESKAFTGNIEPGRSASRSRAATRDSSGPTPNGHARDLPIAGPKPDEPVQEKRESKAKEPDHLLPPHEE